MLGKTLGHYRILEKIGAGGMGEVYRARDERLERDVALKVLPAGLLADEAARKRFRKEALALSRLNHPNIETVHNFDTQEGVDFLVMEYVAGETLEEKLKQGPLAEKDAARLGVQLADGLAAAHAQGIVHRDLKPANLRVTPDGRLKILDFGLAKLLRPVSETATTQSLTEAQAVAGTLPYMAPEQLRGEPLDVRTDIWAAGVVLYELATGRRPFPEDSAPRLTDSILHAPPVAPRAFNPRVSPAVENIILKCLEKDPESRYQSAKELGVDLRRLSAPTPLAPPRLGPRGSMWWVLRIGGVGLATAALLAVLIGLNVGGLRERLLGRVGGPRIESLAVLPLKNLMGDPEQEYFVEGMHEALITELSKIGALRVISRTSAMRYKESKKPLPEIAGELNVDALIEGSVLRSGNRVRVTAQLIGAEPERHLWANSYDRDLSDILALTSDVARAVAAEIKLTLTPQEQARLASARPVNPEAYEAYLRGRYHWNKFTREGMLKAIDSFEEAIRQDPTYARAYAGLAETYAWAYPRIAQPPRELLAKAKAAAQKALELDNTLAEAHASLAMAKQSEWDWAGAEKEYRRALEVNPNYANAHAWYAQFMALKGDFEEALAEIKRAEELDPLSLLIKAQIGWLYFWAGETDHAIEQWRKTLDLDPNFGLAHYNLGLGHTQKGMYEEAIADYHRALAVGMEAIGPTWGLGYAYARAGRRDDALKILAQLNEQSKREYVPQVWIGVVHLALGNKDEALNSLQKAYQDGDPFLAFLRLEPFWFDPLRDDPRFQDLLRRMNFPQ